jgi:hypothetical protein
MDRDVCCGPRARRNTGIAGYRPVRSLWPSRALTSPALTRKT